ncbi:MAG: DUF1289 domain-containing protein [Pseudomonadota bacterium]
MGKRAKPVKIPSPCVDVCKYKRAGHCIACSMTKPQKKIFKRLKKPEQQAGFVEMLKHQQAQLGRYDAWPQLYAKKLGKKTATRAKAA